MISPDNLNDFMNGWEQRQIEAENMIKNANQFHKNASLFAPQASHIDKDNFNPALLNEIDNQQKTFDDFLNELGNLLEFYEKPAYLQVLFIDMGALSLEYFLLWDFSNVLEDNKVIASLEEYLQRVAQLKQNINVLDNEFAVPGGNVYSATNTVLFKRILEAEITLKRRYLPLLIKEGKLSQQEFDSQEAENTQMLNQLQQRQFGSYDEGIYLPHIAKVFRERVVEKYVPPSPTPGNS